MFGKGNAELLWLKRCVLGCDRNFWCYIQGGDFGNVGDWLRRADKGTRCSGSFSNLRANLALDNFLRDGHILQWKGLCWVGKLLPSRAYAKALKICMACIWHVTVMHASSVAYGATPAEGRMVYGAHHSELMFLFHFAQRSAVRFFVFNAPFSVLTAPSCLALSGPCLCARCSMCSAFVNSLSLAIDNGNSGAFYKWIGAAGTS